MSTARALIESVIMRYVLRWWTCGVERVAVGQRLTVAQAPGSRATARFAGAAAPGVRPGLSGRVYANGNVRRSRGATRRGRRQVRRGQLSPVVRAVQPAQEPIAADPDPRPLSGAHKPLVSYGLALLDMAHMLTPALLLCAVMTWYGGLRVWW